MTRKVRVGDKLRFKGTKCIIEVEDVGTNERTFVGAEHRRGQVDRVLYAISEIGDVLEFVDEPTHAHTFKVGDKGKTADQGVDYEITAVGRERMLATVFGYPYEIPYRLDGTPAAVGYPALLPPKRHIQGWLIVSDDCSCFVDTEEEKRGLLDNWKQHDVVARACIYIDIEEGAGL